MPGLLQASDGMHYVVKMRGAGQGPLVLVAEVLTAAIAGALGLRVPPLAVVDIPPRFGSNEADPEVRDLLRSSVGANVGLAYVDEATTFDEAAGDVLPEHFASRTVWLDSFLLNVDRTARNPNLLMQRGQPFLIDHGAALYPQHNRETFPDKAALPFAQIGQHLLLASATNFAREAGLARKAMTPQLLSDAVNAIPDDLWPRENENGYGPPHEFRALYLAFLEERLRNAPIFEGEVLRAQRAIHTGL